MIGIAMLSRWHVHATEYALEAESIPGVRIAAVWDEVEERGRQWASELSSEFESSLDKLLGRSDIHAVIITSATNMHKELIIKAASAGKHIFTEKVMAPIKKDCETIAEAIRNSGVKFCISLPKRGFPENLFAKKVIEENLLGNITLIRIREAHNGASAKWLPEYFYEPDCCGGGAMIDLGAHPMYMARWLLGEPRTIISMFNSFEEHQVEDNAVSIIEFKNKALAVVETSFVSSFSPYSLELYGTEGALLVGGAEKKVRIRTEKMNGVQSGWTIVDELPKALPSPIKQWIDGIIDGKEISYGIEEGIQLTELIEASYNSFIEGKKVYFRN